MSNLFFNSPLKFHDSDGDIKRFIGAEIEVNTDGHYNNYGDYCRDFDQEPVIKAVKKWSGSIVHDGTCSFEINTSPARGQAFVDQINDICEALKKGGATVKDNCGLHLHIDVRDYTADDLVKMVGLWLKVENSMFERVHQARKDNHFCEPWGSDYGDELRHFDLTKNTAINLLYLGSALYGGEVDDYVFTEKDGGERYRAMNFHSYFYMKTLENRMHEGTLSANKIIKWAKLNSKLVDFAKKKSVKEIAALPKDTDVTTISRSRL